MTHEVVLLILGAMTIYLLVLSTHSLRRRFGSGCFYALLGGIAAIMSWVTDAGVSIEVGGITFMVGSTVFYTSLLLGVFVIYVFDGPRETRITISTIAGITAMMPLIAAVLHSQAGFLGITEIGDVPVPSLRINSASVFTTIVDLIFLAIAWEYFGEPVLRIRLWLRTFLTLLGVMWLDVLLFSTLAFAGTPDYLNIMKGTLISRFLVSIFALPFLYGYLRWQSRERGLQIENRPILAILQRFAEVEVELSQAREEIQRRRAAELERDKVIQELSRALAEVKTLRGLIPICATCKNVRDDQGYWKQIEEYLTEHSDAEFSHGICPNCMAEFYPEFTEEPD